MRETVSDKAGRLLTDNRVFVRFVRPEIVRAVVRGDSGIHTVDLIQGRWSCSCAARRGACSHLAAVWAVTVPEKVS